MGQVDVDVADKNLKVLGLGRCCPGRHLVSFFKGKICL